jgi:hypothetical protein
MNPNLNLNLNVNLTVGGSVNPHNRHLHQAWAPRSCVEEYHHLVFATATSAVTDVLRKWDRKLQEKRAALARRRQSTATVAVVAVAAAAAAAAVAVGQGQSQWPGSQGQRPRGRSTGSMEELGGKGRPRGRSAGSLGTFVRWLLLGGAVVVDPSLTCSTISRR